MSIYKITEMEIKDLQIKAIAKTCNETIVERMDDFVYWAKCFKTLKPATQKRWVEIAEEEYRKQITEGSGTHQNLYEIGIRYMRWQIWLDLYTNGY